MEGFGSQGIYRLYRRKKCKETAAKRIATLASLIAGNREKDDRVKWTSTGNKGDRILSRHEPSGVINVSCLRPMACSGTVETIVPIEGKSKMN